MTSLNVSDLLTRLFMRLGVTRNLSDYLAANENGSLWLAHPITADLNGRWSKVELLYSIASPQY